MHPDPQMLALALRSLAPRHTQLLTWRFLERKSKEACATVLGVSVEAIALHSLRALEALDAALERRAPRLSSDADEKASADGVEYALAQAGAAPRDVASGVLVNHARAITAHAVAIEKALRDAQLAEEQSPARQREDWLRRIAILALIGLAAFFYFRGGR